MRARVMRDCNKATHQSSDTPVAREVTNSENVLVREVSSFEGYGETEFSSGSRACFQRKLSKKLT